MMMMSKTLERRERITFEHQGMKYRQKGGEKETMSWGRGDDMTSLVRGKGNNRELKGGIKVVGVTKTGYKTKRKKYLSLRCEHVS